MDKLQNRDETLQPGTVVEPVELPPGADASLGLAYGQEIVIGKDGTRQVVTREIGKKAHQLPRLTY